MRARSRELVTTDESTVIAKSFLDAVVMEHGQRDRRFANSSGADESDRFEVFGKTNDLLDQFFTSETDPGRRGRGFPVCTR